MQGLPSLVATSLLLLILREGGLEAADIARVPWKSYVPQAGYSRGLVCRIRGGESTDHAEEGIVGHNQNLHCQKDGHDSLGTVGHAIDSKDDHENSKEAAGNSASEGGGAREHFSDGIHGHIPVMIPGTCKVGDTVVITGKGVVSGEARAFMGLPGVVAEKGSEEGSWKIKFDSTITKEFHEGQLGHFKNGDPEDCVSLAAGKALWKRQKQIEITLVL
jgi:hypothetical protein